MGGMAVIIDGDVHILVAGPVDDLSAIAMNPMAGPQNARQRPVAARTAEWAAAGAQRGAGRIRIRYGVMRCPKSDRSSRPAP